MQLVTEPYRDQIAYWPPAGRHVLAQYAPDSVVVYQAYRAEIADYAVSHQRFGGTFSLGRMSWIKPNFLWMMYRSDWGTREGQERVLALHLPRGAFDTILRRAVHSSFQTGIYPSREAWSHEVASSDVRLQWDPDHGPTGEPVARRAIQLGLRGATLAAFATEWLTCIEDISGFVSEQRRLMQTSPDALITPRERVLTLAPDIASRLGADAWSPNGEVERGEM